MTAVWRFCVMAWMLLAFLAVEGRAADAVPGSLTIAPAEFVLVSSRARQPVIVSGRFDDNTITDLTRTVTYESRGTAIAVVDKQGLVVPRGNGSTEIIVRQGKLQAAARVTVRDFGQPRRVDFRTEVIGALSRGGCNQGACHGSPKGKGGFRLSLRGFDPNVDYRSLSRDSFGRRVNPTNPAESLILQKASGKVAHEGGLRFRSDAPAFNILRAWIAEGREDSAAAKSVARLEVLPERRFLHTSNPQQQLVVRAHYSDGSIDDVTHLAAFSSADEQSAQVSRSGLVEFEGTAEAAILVRFLDQIKTARLTYIRRDPGFAFAAPPEANYVDRHVFAKHRELQLRPAELAGDSVFLRRVYLDLIGAIPTPDEARAFLDSKKPDKRAKLIDQLLNRKEFAFFWGLKWADVMRGNRETVTERGVHNLHRYLVNNFAADRPFDEVAREILTGLGNTVNVPAASFYRIARTPTDTAESFSQLFLGVRIQCAKCHNHPYESITQNDYYGLAAYFARVKLKGKRFGLDDETVYLDKSGEVKFPGTDRVLQPIAFGTPAGPLNPTDDRRERLADWLTRADNPYFARSTVNRIWAHLLGQGIVDPIDDFRDSNLPSNPALLDALAEEFVKNGYRFKPVIRSILNSRTYQLSAQFVGKQSEYAAAPDRYFTKAVVRMLSAEQILDAISTATGIPEPFPNYPLGTRAIELAEGDVEHKFLKAFTKPIRDVACDCARETDPTLSQVVHLMNNPQLLNKIDSNQSRLGRWLKDDLATDAIIERLYLATLCRRPSDQEQSSAEKYVTAQQNRTEALRDLQHALLNSNEFLLRH